MNCTHTVGAARTYCSARKWIKLSQVQRHNASPTLSPPNRLLADLGSSYFLSIPVTRRIGNRLCAVTSFCTLVRFHLLLVWGTYGTFFLCICVFLQIRICCVAWLCRIQRRVHENMNVGCTVFSRKYEISFSRKSSEQLHNREYFRKRTLSGVTTNFRMLSFCLLVDYYMCKSFPIGCQVTMTSWKLSVNNSTDIFVPLITHPCLTKLYTYSHVLSIVSVLKKCGIPRARTSWRLLLPISLFVNWILLALFKFYNLFSLEDMQYRYHVSDLGRVNVWDN